MINRATKLRWRRKFRRSQYRAMDMTQTADEHLERHFIKRLNRLLQVKRFVFGWLLLLSLLVTGLILQIRHLSPYYQSLQPIPGGIFTEGVLGSFTNASPLYATGTVDNSVSKLVFSGLLKYDQNNRLVNDLTQSWSLDENETTYTFKLRPNLLWHDGQPLTADDVVFTFHSIQNPDVKSPLFNSWRGINIEAKDPQTVIFKLPNIFSAFPLSLTTGIIPKHLLQSIPPVQLRSDPFNTAHPIGSGPFKWQAIEIKGEQGSNQRQQQIGFVPNENYHLGPSKLSHLVITTFNQDKDLINSLKAKTISAAVGLAAVPDEIKDDHSIIEYDIPLTSAVLAFFNNSNSLLSDAKLRRALVLAADTKQVIASLGYPAVIVNEPLLKNQVGYAADLTQQSYNLDEANKQLDALGWVRDPTTGLRAKAGHKLAFKLFSENTTEYTTVTQMLQKQWRQVGVDVEVTLRSDQDLQSTIAFHDYDILVYGISLGIDPDVFAYWHSSQADIRAPSHLNLSEYRSTVADRALEAGRTRSDPSLRAVKYRPFLEAWRADNPALALYQPRFLYLVRAPLYNFNPTTMNQSADRFNDVNNWMIRESRSTK